MEIISVRNWETPHPRTTRLHALFRFLRTDKHLDQIKVTTALKSLTENIHTLERGRHAEKHFSID